MRDSESMCSEFDSRFGTDILSSENRLITAASLFLSVSANHGSSLLITILITQ